MVVATVQPSTQELFESSSNGFEKCNSPFRHAGEKLYARDQILPEIPLHTHYCEPFAGNESGFDRPRKLTSDGV